MCTESDNIPAAGVEVVTTSMQANLMQKVLQGEEIIPFVATTTRGTTTTSFRDGGQVSEHAFGAGATATSRETVEHRHQSRIEQPPARVGSRGMTKEKLSISEIEIVDNFELEQGSKPIPVKGRLRNCLEFWKNIEANEFVLNTIKYGYSLPLLTNPSKVELKNNKSANDNNDFVVAAINELLVIDSVREVSEIPHVVNPLTVSVNHKGKKRLVLDLRHVNPHLWKDRIKFDDWRVANDYLAKNGYMYSFDFKSGYHHIEINSEFQTYLGFSWVINGKKRYFVFNVLPFGLSTAGHVFTKVVRCLVKRWRSLSIKIVVYLDDGLGVEETKQLALEKSKIVYTDIEKSGFVLNIDKTIFEPTQELIWLGMGVDLNENEMFVPIEKISTLRTLIENMIQSKRCTARQLARVTGKINSTYLVLGSIVRLMTKYAHMAICTRVHWDMYFAIENDIMTELKFWASKLSGENKKKLFISNVATRIVYTDASKSGCGGFIVDMKQPVIHRSWTGNEIEGSSAKRELAAVVTVLGSVKHLLKDQVVKWYTDNQAVVSIINNGSMKQELQDLALSVYESSVENNIDIQMEWIPRTENEKADYISRIIDHDDWGVTQEFFKYIDSVWGPHTADVFASANNFKVKKFYSKYWTPGSYGVDAFAFNWKYDNNWLVPPIYLIQRVINCMLSTKSVGTLIIPEWQSSAFWPVLVNKNGEFREFVKNKIVFEKGTVVYQNGSVRSIFNDRFKSRVWALRINAI